MIFRTTPVDDRTDITDHRYLMDGELFVVVNTHLSHFSKMAGVVEVKGQSQSSGWEEVSGRLAQGSKFIRSGVSYSTRQKDSIEVTSVPNG